MEQSKEDAIEKMKKIQEANRSDPNQAQDRAMQSPYYIHRPTAPKVSAEAALPMGWQQQEQMEQDRQQILEGLRNMTKPVQDPNTTVEKETKSQTLKQDTFSTAVNLFVQTDKDVPFTPGSAKETVAQVIEKQKQEPQQAATNEPATYYGHKMTQEQQEICQGLKQNLTKGRAMTNIESMRMKHKQ